MIRKKHSLGDIIFNICIYTVFTSFALICIFPFYYIFINTISDNHLVATGRILLVPKQIHFENYVKIMQIKGLANATLITLARTVIGTAGTVLASSFLGYTMSKQEMWKRKIWYRFIVVTMYFNAGLIPGYILLKNLSLLNNFLVYVLPALVAPFYLILFKTYVESLPSSLEEAAQIDGAGYLKRYFLIVMPMSKPILATIVVFTSVNQWNAFMDTLLYIRSSSLYTLQFILYQYLNEVNSVVNALRSATGGRMIDPSRLLTPIAVRMTISIVVVFPILFVYPFFQRFFVKGIMVGAVKG